MLVAIRLGADHDFSTLKVDKLDRHAQAQGTSLTNAQELLHQYE